MSPALITLRIAILLFAVEGLLMLFGPALPIARHAETADLKNWILAVADATTLVAICSPVIFFWVIRPYILARDTAENAIRQSEQRMNEAQRIAQVGSWVLDLTSNKLTWSDEVYRIFEIDPQFFDATYEAFLDAIHPEDREIVSKAYSASLVDRVPYEIAHRLRMPDGRIKWVRERCETKFDSNGRPKVSLGTVQDISARHIAESALRENRAMLSEVLEISDEAIILAGDDLRITLFSHGAERLFGYSATEAVGLSIEELIPERFRSRHSDHVEDFAKGSSMSLHMAGRREVVGLRKNGEEFPASVSLSKFDSGSRHIYSMIVRDLGPEKAVHDKLLSAKLAAEATNRAKSDFLANMSHELRTPLNAIIGFSEMLCRQMYGPLGNAKYLECGNAINESGNHLLAIISDVLDLSKIEAGKTDLEEKVIDMSAAIRSCLLMVKDRAERGNLKLKSELQEELPLLYADERAVKQIVINLLSNAIKFTPAGGKVELRVWFRRDAGYVIQITDTGIGIAAKDIPVCLAPFMQVDGDLNRRFEGTGLGLPLSKSLIELHGGSLDLQSRVGSGTTVTVRFPAQRIVPQAVAAS